MNPRRANCHCRKDRCQAQKMFARASVQWTEVAILLLLHDFVVGLAAGYLTEWHHSEVPLPMLSSGCSRYFALEVTLPPLKSCEQQEQHFPIRTIRNGLISSWSTSELLQNNELPVLYTNHPQRVEKWLHDHIPTGISFLGFDTESVPRFNKNGPYPVPSTVQIATSKASLVVHLVRSNGKRSQACAPVLQAVLHDANIIKVGCSIDDDIISLYNAWGAPLSLVQSRLDLSTSLCCSGGEQQQNTGRMMGLKRLSHTILRAELPKSRKVCLSNWAQVPLKQAQIAYSARDAWVAAAVMDTMQQHRLSVPQSHSPLQSGGSSQWAMLDPERLVSQLRVQPNLVAIYERMSARQELRRLGKINPNDDTTTSRQANHRDRQRSIEELQTFLKCCKPSPPREPFDLQTLGYSMPHDPAFLTKNRRKSRG